MEFRPIRPIGLSMPQLNPSQSTNPKEMQQVENRQALKHQGVELALDLQTLLRQNKIQPKRPTLKKKNCQPLDIQGGGGGGSARQGGTENSAGYGLDSGVAQSGETEMQANTNTELPSRTLASVEDPEDYLTRIDKNMNIFKQVEKKYFEKATSWALIENKK